MSIAYGAEAPELSTDHPEVVIMKQGGDGILPWYQTATYVRIEVIGAGDANLYVNLRGEVQEIIPIHAEIYVPDPNDTEEDLQPAP